MNTPDCLLRPEGVGSLQDSHPAWRSSLRLYFGPCLELIISRYAQKSIWSCQLSSPHHYLLSQPCFILLAMFFDTQAMTGHLHSSAEALMYTR